MAWRTIVAPQPARLRIDADRLIVAQEAETALPLEDIACLILESPQALLSSSVLSRMAERGALLIACGPNHLPVLLGLPFAWRQPGRRRMRACEATPHAKFAR